MFIAMSIAQGIGAILGVLAASGGFDLTEDVSVTAIPPTHHSQRFVAQLCPRNGCNDGGELVLKVFMVEAACTFLFVSFIFMIKKHNGSQ